MRMHTAAHILIFVMYGEGNVLVTGNHLDVEKSRIDFSLEDMDRQKVEDCFRKANCIVQQDIYVTFTFMKREDVMMHKHLTKLAAGCLI